MVKLSRRLCVLIAARVSRQLFISLPITAVVSFTPGPIEAVDGNWDLTPLLNY